MITPNNQPQETEAFSFETVRVDVEGQIIERLQRTGQFFREDLGDGISLEMVKIPAGTFLMGSLNWDDNASPQHQVAVSEFFLGKYPVTQAQWKAVTALPKVNRDLKTDPSHFKGDNRPVERVSWYDAVEFCARLSRYAGKDYQLPSEAQWEYACRAGTTTPFHFGETITIDLVNCKYRVAVDTTGLYDPNNLESDYYPSDSVYEAMEYEESPDNLHQTNDVGHFQVANAFGLYDMHGNVREWCADDWHLTYKNAPTDGSAWFDHNKTLVEEKKDCCILRGGSWYDCSHHCHSTYRNIKLWRSGSSFNIGFRIVCVSERTL